MKRTKEGKYIIVDEYGDQVGEKVFFTKNSAKDFLRYYQLGKNDDGLSIKQITFPLLPTNWKKK